MKRALFSSLFLTGNLQHPSRSKQEKLGNIGVWFSSFEFSIFFSWLDFTKHWVGVSKPPRIKSFQHFEQGFL
jgi:hypothetical protein